MFLYIAIACFAGLVSIFVVDGYLGIYDTFHIAVGEYPPQTISADYWLNEGYGGYVPRAGGTEGDQNAYCCINAEQDQNISFEYIVENHTSSVYSEHIEVSIWKEGEKVKDLLTQNISVGAFDDIKMDWTLSTDDLAIIDPVTDYSYMYTVLVRRGDIERRVIVSFYYPRVRQEFKLSAPVI